MTNGSRLRVVAGAAVLAGAVGISAYHGTRDRAGAALDAGRPATPPRQAEGWAPPTVPGPPMRTAPAASNPAVATTASPPRQEAAPDVPASPGEPARAPAPPQFDVVRLGARGTVVVAGRAAPGAEVLLLEGGRELGRARADARGEWVILPNDPLGAGPRELSLRARILGGDEVRGLDTVLLVGPAPAEPALVAAAAATAPLAPVGDAAAPVLRAVPPPETSLVLLLPPIDGASPRALLPGADPAVLGLEVVDYDDGDTIRFAGTAPAGARLRVYADERHLGDTKAGADGRWSLTPVEAPAVGRHSLRVDQLGPGDLVPVPVTGRIQVAFLREALPAGLVREGRVVVQPGDNLWRIARDSYGRGTRYTVIYRANQDQLRSPDRIFPGQVLAVPPAP